MCLPKNRCTLLSLINKGNTVETSRKLQVMLVSLLGQYTEKLDLEELKTMELDSPYEKKAPTIFTLTLKTEEVQLKVCVCVCVCLYVHACVRTCIHCLSACSESFNIKCVLFV